VKDDLFNVEVEMAALGSMMLQLSVRDSRKMIEYLEPRDFYIPSHRRIYECFDDLTKKGIPLDIITISSWFDKPDKNGKIQETIEQVGGLLYIHEIYHSCPDSSNGEYYAENVKRLAFLRRLREAAQKVATEVVVSGQEPADMHASALELFTACKPSGSDMIDLANLKEFGNPEGIETHLPSLNNITGCGGIPRGQMTIFAARKKVGKSSNMIALACHACKNDLRVGYYTLADLDARGIKKRMVQQETSWGVRPYSLEQSTDYDNKIGEIEMVWNFNCRDVPNGLSRIVETLCVTIDQDNARYKFDLVCIDYAQKLRSSTERDRVRALEKASGDLSDLAASCGFALCVGSQLNADGQTRYSQEFEDDAGLVVQFSRPEPDQELVEVDVPYNRFGPEGSFNARWDKYRIMVTE